MGTSSMILGGNWILLLLSINEHVRKGRSTSCILSWEQGFGFWMPKKAPRGIKIIGYHGNRKLPGSYQTFFMNFESEQIHSKYNQISFKFRFFFCLVRWFLLWYQDLWYPGGNRIFCPVMKSLVERVIMFNILHSGSRETEYPLKGMSSLNPRRKSSKEV